MVHDITWDQAETECDEFQVSLHIEELYYLLCSFRSSQLSSVHGL